MSIDDRRGNAPGVDEADGARRHSQSLFVALAQPRTVEPGGAQLSLQLRGVAEDDARDPRSCRKGRT
jgi:hypothetical protein